MNKRPYSERGHDGGGGDRGYEQDYNRDNKRHRDDRRDGRNNQGRILSNNDPDNRDRRPQPPQDGQFRNRNKKQEHRKDGGKERTPQQVDVILEENHRIKAELKALKASIAQGNTTSTQLSHSDALNQLPPLEGILTDVALYTPFTVPGGLPQLPPVADDALRSAVFKHKSIYKHHRDGAEGVVTYEKLEYLGDAYLELFASRLIYHRFPKLASGQMSQGRETLVKNETLAQFSRAYGFDKKVQVDKGVMSEIASEKGNKGFNKILGDVLEAYVAAVVLSHEDGFAAAEKWLTALWAPKMLELYHSHGTLLTTPDNADPSKVYNPNAVPELQRRIGIGLEYKDMGTVELKNDQLGKNEWYMNLYLNEFGYTKELLATGKGSNKKEAKAWAATKAMHGKSKFIIEECEVKYKEWRDKRKAERALEGNDQPKEKSDSVGTAS